MHVAADLGNVELVETLRKAGGDLKVVNKVSSWASLCLAELIAESSLSAVSLER